MELKNLWTGGVTVREGNFVEGWSVPHYMPCYEYLQTLGCLLEIGDMCFHS